MNAPPIQEWLQTGFRHHEAGRWDEAAQWYGRVRRAQPKNFDAAHLDGTRALQQGRFDEAEKTLALARRLSPKSGLCTMRWGIALFALKRFPEAEAAFREALALDPKLPEAWFHVGQTCRRLGRLPEAAEAFERAIALRSDYAEAYDRLGTLVSLWKGPVAAEPYLLKATQLDPKLATSWCNLGMGWIFQGRLSDALAALGKAIELQPNFDHAHAGRGLALAKCFRSEQAEKEYARAIELNPHNFEAHSARLVQLQYDERQSRAELFREHLRFGRAVEGEGDRSPLAPADPDPDRPLRIGIVSPDLHRHSIAYFLEPLLRHLDRTSFHVLLYHDSAKHDGMSDRLQALAAGWTPVAGVPTDALEARLRADRLDVLLDLAGHTGFNRLPLYACRVAPVQATYLGYPDTTGLRSMDYRLVDARTDPPGEADAHCTEKLLRFAPTAWSYEPPECAPEPAPSPCALGAAVTFGCFNNFAKIGDATLRRWSRLLTAVPGSRLLIKGHGITVSVLNADLMRRLQAAGIDSARVTVLDRIASIAEHLAAYGRMDVALDTFPYHGTTTTCEALWMGVPVVTCEGDRHASRVGMSLLQAVGRPEWVAAGEDGYIAIAKRLASEAAASPAPRTALREALRASTLMDHPAQARRFGEALRTMWRETVARHNSAGVAAGVADPGGRPQRGRLQPPPSESAAGLLELGNRLKRLGRHREALEPLTRATELEPTHAVAWLNRGVSHLELGERAGAVTCFERAVALAPGRADARNILGHALLTQGRCGEAAGQLQEALRLKPDYAAAQDNLGRVRKAQGRAGEALELHRAALRAEYRPSTHSNLLYTLNLVALPPEEIFREHVRWGQRLTESLPVAAGRLRPANEPRRPAPARLRIGYLSPDFCHHAVAFFIAAALEHHDRSAFEIFCYSDVKAPDAVTDRLRGWSEHWRDTAGWSDEAVAARIRDDEIDLLVDLAGHTGGNRLRVLALRPAPVQATWLGYPNTTGLKQVDYRLTDPIADPAGETDRWHTETLVRLDGPFSCYRPPDEDVDPTREARADGTIVFGCFNHLAKVTDAMVGVWAELLRAVPAAKLFLKSRGLADAPTRADLEGRFAAVGIPRNRLELSGEELGVSDHLALYRRVDVALDTYPYNGATTTCEALWMGVPVVTWAGSTHVSRVGASMLTHAGLAEGIANDASDYVAIAARFAAAPGNDRREQRQRFVHGPLCQGAAHTRSLEGAYAEMTTAKTAVGEISSGYSQNCNKEEAVQE